MDRAVMASTALQRSHPITRFDHVAALLLERLPDDLPDLVFVLHQEHGQTGKGPVQSGMRGFSRRCLAGHPWQIDVESCPFSNPAGDRNLTATLLHDRVDGRESKSGPLSQLLGREERFEHPALGARVHPFSGVPDPQLNVGAGREKKPAGLCCRKIDVASPDRKRPPFGHRVAGIEGKVE